MTLIVEKISGGLKSVGDRSLENSKYKPKKNMFAQAMSAFVHQQLTNRRLSIGQMWKTARVLVIKKRATPDQEAAQERVVLITH